MYSLHGGASPVYLSFLMKCFVRPLIYQIIAIFFALMSLGWSVANAHDGKNLNSISQKTAISSGEFYSGLHDGNTVLKKFTQLELEDVDCADDFFAGEATSGCCITACHTVLETHGPALLYRVRASVLRYVMPATGILMSMIGRLDRPPRLAEKIVG